MSEQLQTPLEIGQEKNIRTQLFRATALLNTGGAAIALIISVIAGLVNPKPSTWSVAIAIGLYTLVALFSYWLSIRGHQSWAVGVFLISVTAILFLLTYYTNGVTGPLAIVLIAIPLSAQLFGGRQLSRWTLWSIIILYLGMSGMEALGILQPVGMHAVILRITYGILLFTTAGITVSISAMFNNQSQQVLSTAQQRSQELAEANRQTEEAAFAERESKEREERAVQQLRQAVKKYTIFLEQVITGNYSTRLVLEDIRGDEISDDLHTLGEYINTAVEALVGALSNLQAVQRRYVRGAWESYTSAGKQRSFRYSKEKGMIIPDEDIDIPDLIKGLGDKNAAADKGELTLPIELHGEIIGTIVARRDTNPEWNDEDIALSTAINDQLAQTIENLRLLEETQRRAERERLTSRVTTSMRETLDMDTILQTAVREMRENMNLHDVMVKLGNPNEQSVDQHPDSAETSLTSSETNDVSETSEV